MPADELRLFAQGVLVDGDDFFIGYDGEGGVGEVGVEDAAEHEGGFVDGPHAEVEAFFFGGEDVETDAEREGLVGVGVVGAGNVQEHVHVGEGTGLGVSPVGDNLVCDAPDASPGVVDVVAHSPCVANFRSPVISQMKSDFGRHDTYHSPTFSPIPHWQRKYWNERSTFSKLVAIF